MLSHQSGGMGWDEGVIYNIFIRVMLFVDSYTTKIIW
jgi:hypothetical protein